ncbi:MAG: mandelate racemase/muconate lactonizing enzyme family protein [Opitutus sp.]
MISPRIAAVRPVLLSAPYSDAEDMEVLLHLPSGWRTTGLVEIKLDNGIVGLGEGYLAVFAPRVFEEIVRLVAPVLIGGDPHDLKELYRQISVITGYWSLQGAAQHVISAVEIALQDCRAQLLDVPVWQALGGSPGRRLQLYASGGDAIGPVAMGRELDRIQHLGIDLVKIRARHQHTDKARWCQQHAAQCGIRVAIDMTQNLVVPSQSIADIQRFLFEITDGGRDAPPVFLEEALGPEAINQYPRLRREVAAVPMAGGEIVTTAAELCQRIEAGCYDIAQPDATVIGGISAVLEVFTTAQRCGVEVYVHCWGGPVSMMANYHAALAGGGTIAEWPIKSYPLRDALVTVPWQVAGGRLTLPGIPGLGVRLTPEIELMYPFREDAVYRCLVDPSQVPVTSWPSPTR